MSIEKALALYVFTVAYDLTVTLLNGKEYELKKGDTCRIIGDGNEQSIVIIREPKNENSPGTCINFKY
jgi:hypothetical protein